MDIYKNNSNYVPPVRKDRLGSLFFGLFILCFLFIALSVPHDYGIPWWISASIFHTSREILSFSFYLGIISLTLGVFLTKKRTIKMIAGSVLGIILLFSFISIFMVRSHKVKGNSMSPNILSDEYVFSDLVSYRFRTPERGDIVIFHPPYSPEIEGISRIIGLPGEYISIHDGHVYINNEPLIEPYLARNMVTYSGNLVTSSSVLIPRGQYAVLGDNRNHSFDSRSYGFVEINNIKEKAFFIYWPLNHSGGFELEKPRSIEKF